METRPDRQLGPALPVDEDTQGLGALAESVRTFCFVLFRHRRKGVVFFTAVVLAALIGVLFSARSYTSTAKLIVRPGRSSMTMDPTASIGLPLHAISKDWENEINSELEILKSREIIEQLVREFGAETILSGGKRRDGTSENPNRFVAALETVERRLTIDVFKKTDIISISYTAATPDHAQEVVARLIELYLDKHMEVRQTAGAYAFFEEQAKRLRADLERAEVALRNFKNVFGIASLGEQQTLMLGRIRELQNQLADAAAERAEALARVDAIRVVLGGGEGEGAGRRTLLGSKEYQEMQAVLVNEQTRLSASTARMSELRRQLTELERELQGLNDSETRIRALERDRDLQVAKFTTYTEGLEQARINRVLDEEKVSNISTVQNPSRPWQSNPRRRPLKLLLAMLFGAIGSVALAFVSESMDHSLKRPEEVQSRLGLPALTVLPLVDGSRLAPFARGIRATAWDTPDWAVKPLDMLHDRIGRVFTPALASSVLLGVTACRRDEGVTGVASTLALTLARRRPGETVLYVDANAGGEPNRRVFGLRRAGAVELVMEPNGRIAAVERSLEPEPPQAGKGEEAKPALYERWMPLIRKQDYRYVVFDLPPVSAERAALQLCGSVDGVLLVVEAEGLRREIIRRSLDLLRESKANVLGIVFNKRRFHVPEWLYRLL
jgi:uncharacterized protein involved in exopolysaccharide biosynthesis/Mrp family chromosome partitioning ATPase